MRFKFFPHTADIKFRAYGKTIEESFSNSAYALINSVFEGKIKESKKFRISASGKDFESLLYNFLEELLFLIDSENFFVSKITKLKIDKKNFRLSAIFSGDFGENYKIQSDIKAITYNEMFVKNKDKKWTTQVVLDV